MSPADARLVLLAMAGDEGAFTALVASRQGRVRTLLRRALGDAARADDTAQAVFMKAWKNIGSVRSPAAFDGWLRRIAVNAAIDAMRRLGPIDQAVSEDLPAPAADPDQRLDLETALARLSFPARTCVLLHHAEGLTHSEIAEETGMPLGTVKSHIARGTAYLRAALAGWRTADA